MPCLKSPLVDRKPSDIDFYIVRENTEGEYSNSGVRLFEGTEREVVIQESIFTRIGANRVLKFAFELAQKRGKHLTAATKSNSSEEPTSELQSLMRPSYAVYCLKKNNSEL